MQRPSGPGRPVPSPPLRVEHRAGEGRGGGTECAAHTEPAPPPLPAVDASFTACRVVRARHGHVQRQQAPALGLAGPRSFTRTYSRHSRRGAGAGSRSFYAAKAPPPP